MLADLLSRLESKPNPAPLPERCLKYLLEHGIPEDIIADIKASSYSDWIQIGPLSLVPMPELIDLTTGILPCMENGFLVLAGGANGDPVAVERQTRRMVFVSHDILWSDDWRDFCECVQETPFLYEDFWDQVVTDKEFPWDYYEAQRRWHSSND